MSIENPEDRRGEDDDYVEEDGLSEEDEAEEWEESRDPDNPYLPFYNRARTFVDEGMLKHLLDYTDTLRENGFAEPEITALHIDCLTNVIDREISRYEGLESSYKRLFQIFGDDIGQDREMLVHRRDYIAELNQQRQQLIERFAGYSQELKKILDNI